MWIHRLLLLPFLLLSITNKNNLSVKAQPCVTTEPRNIQTKLFIEMTGTPDRFTSIELEQFESILQNIISCNSAVDDSIVEVVSVTVDERDEILSSNDTSTATTTTADGTSSSSINTTNETETDSGSVTNPKNSTTVFLWTVSVDVVTTLASVEDYRFLESTQQQPEDRSLSSLSSMLKDPSKHTANGSIRQRNLQESCGCDPPTAEGLVAALNVAIGSSSGGLLQTFLLQINRILEAEPKPCEQVVNTFTSNIGIQLVGNVDLVTEESLSAIASTFQSTYNGLNGIINCDLQFRSLTRSTALVDPFSIELGGGGPPNTAGGGSTGTRIRRVQDVTGSMNATVNATVMPSMDPSDSPSSSAAPSDVTSAEPSSFLTTAPTTRGPDLFTILIQLEGECKGCTSEQFLFNQGTTGQRRHTTKVVKEEEEDGDHDDDNLWDGMEFFDFRKDIITGSDNGHDGGDRGLNDGLGGGCFCPVGVSESSVPQETFVQQWEDNLEKETQDDTNETGNEEGQEGDGGDNGIDSDTTNTTAFGGGLSFYGDAGASFEEFRIFDCTEDKDELVALAIAEFVGDLSLLTEGEIAVIEANFLQTFNGLTEESCDPYLRQLSSVKTVQVGFSTDKPTMSPTTTASMEPTVTPVRNLVRKRKRNDHDGRTVMEGISSRNNTTINTGLNGTDGGGLGISNSPTESPTTRGADLFFIEFEVTGTCNQCGSDFSFFDDIITRSSRRSLRRKGQISGGVRLLEERVDANGTSSSTCGCPAAQEEGGVYLYDFLDSFEEAIEESEVESVTETVGIEEIPEEPSATPSASVSPSMMPSVGVALNSSEAMLNLTDVMDGNNTTPSMMPSLYSNWNASAGPTSNSSMILEANNSLPSMMPSLHSNWNVSAGPTSNSSIFLDMNSSVPSMMPSLYLGGNASAGPTSNSSIFLDMNSSAPSMMPSLYLGGNTSVSTLNTTEIIGLDSSAPSMMPSENRESNSSAPSLEASNWNSSSPSSLLSAMPSYNASSIPSAVPSLVPSIDPSSDPSMVPSSVPSNAPSGNPSSDPSSFPSSFPSDFPSNDPSSFPSAFPSDFPSEVPSGYPSSGPSFFPSNAPTDLSSLQPSQLPSRIPSFNPSWKPSGMPSVVPSMIPSHIPSVLPSMIPIPSRSPSSLPSSIPSRAPSVLPSSVPSVLPSGIPSMSLSDMPSSIPSKNPSETPSFVPSGLPSNVPSSGPSGIPSRKPSMTPSGMPSVVPSGLPSSVPSSSPSLPPSDVPSRIPSMSPSGMPSLLPSELPTTFPTLPPSDGPSIKPSLNPSEIPSISPSSMPSEEPSDSPSKSPLYMPSFYPSEVPSLRPSTAPSNVPSEAPSRSMVPSKMPSTAPSMVPSQFPSSPPTSTYTMQLVITISNSSANYTSSGTTSATFYNFDGDALGTARLPQVVSGENVYSIQTLGSELDKVEYTAKSHDAIYIQSAVSKVFPSADIEAFTTIIFFESSLNNNLGICVSTDELDDETNTWSKCGSVCLETVTFGTFSC